MFSHESRGPTEAQNDWEASSSSGGCVSTLQRRRATDLQATGRPSAHL